MTHKGIGARLPRKEDDRYMRGCGQYVADIKLPGMKDVAFARSPVAHAYVHDVRIPESCRDSVFVAEDMKNVEPIRAVSSLPGFKPSEQPPLAVGKVRQVGELVAMCVAHTRAEAEDIAAKIEPEFEELPVVTDMLEARAANTPLVHEEWGDNIYLNTRLDGDIDSVAEKAAISVTREIRTARQCVMPIEGRGVVAYWDARLEQLVVYSAAQMPHITRTGLSECLGLDHARIRVIAPDVGGGFGYKGVLLPEEVCLSWLAMRLRHPVRWIEDRREHLTASANCREHHYVITAYADADGRLQAIDAEATVDSGAYSAYPFSACLEAAQIGSILPGPYDFPVYRCRTWSVASNKAPILPYRGVARTGACAAMELVLDAVAREAGIEPYEMRLKNLVSPEAMPFDNITNRHFDSGDYPESVRQAVEEINLVGIRDRQKHDEPDGRLIGIGFAAYCEQAAHGASVYSGWGIPMVPGLEQAAARITPDGGLELRVGVHSHGQGLETTLSQVANEILGIAHDKITLVHGDTGSTPYSTGTWGSRCMVMAGGAVATACKELSLRLARIGAHLLQAAVEDVAVREGGIHGSSGSITIDEVAKTWYLRPQHLPEDVDPGGLETTAGYKPVRDTGTFSYATHAVLVAVDIELGAVEILDYVVVEDGGVLVNPMIVDGQIYGGVAQGIGTALYEEMLFDEEGQPLASTLADYLVPGPTEVLDVRIRHMQTPSPYTEFGIKGIGEGGAIAPPAAIANAINDALRPLNAVVTEFPITPHRVLAAIARARAPDSRHRTT